jgi:hypothetical protein
MTVDFDEFADRARATLDAPEPGNWRPDRDQSHPRLLIGELAAVVDDVHTSWGPRQIVVVRDSDGGLWNVWLLHKVLIDEFHRQQPKVGEMLAIAYDGRVVPAQGSPYEKYRLHLDRRGQSVAWRDSDGVEASNGAPAAVPAATPAAAAQQPLEPGLEPALCAECGFANGRHAAICPLVAGGDDIPF